MALAADDAVDPVSPRRLAAVRRLARRSRRAQMRRFLVEGPRAVEAALQLRAAGDSSALEELYTTEEAADRNRALLRRAAITGLSVTVVTDRVMSDIAGTVTPQGLLGVAAFRDLALRDLTCSRPRLLTVLATVRDPGNAGTVLRVTDAAGGEGVAFIGDSVDPYNGKCVRSSAGSLFRVPFAIDRATVPAVDHLRDQGLRVLAASADGEEDLHQLAETGGLAGPTAWVFGNEAWGLSTELAAAADAVVRVPIFGRAESLNLATAAAVCLYATARAQRAPGGCRHR